MKQELAKQVFESFEVYLRAIELSDYETTYQWRQDTDIQSMVVGRRYYVSLDYEKKWVNDVVFNSNNNVRLAVCLKDSKKHIGNVYLTDIDAFNKSAIFAKLLGDKAAWGKGFGVQLTMLMLYHGFYDLGLNRIQASQLVTNPASIRVNEKCGFKNEGVMRQAVFKDGAFVDLNLMSILREDFDQKIIEMSASLPR